MYPGAKTWSPYKGCELACTYCEPSFQRQARRQLHHCRSCYEYEPHEHPERVDPKKVPNAETVFIAGNADISFANPTYVAQILEVVREHSASHPTVSYYLQSKRPEFFAQFVDQLPPAVLLVTTLETNRDEGYDAISKAPLPTERHRQFRGLHYARKVITVEPVVEFDLEEFVEMIVEVEPEYVWVGFNSRPKAVSLPEPSEEKVATFIKQLQERGIEVRGKDLRGLTPPEAG